MGINLGAFIGPLICGYLGENIAWKYAFLAAGMGMVLGLIQYKVGAGLGDLGGAPKLDSAGEEQGEPYARRSPSWASVPSWPSSTFSRTAG